VFPNFSAESGDLGLSRQQGNKAVGKSVKDFRGSVYLALPQIAVADVGRMSSRVKDYNSLCLSAPYQPLQQDSHFQISETKNMK
jgi:hypothetical protein